MFHNLLLLEFLTTTLADYLSLKFESSKCLQISRTVLSILADLNNTVVKMIFTSPLIYKFSIPFTKFFGIIPSTPITIDITVTLMFHSFHFSLNRP